MSPKTRKAPRSEVYRGVERGSGRGAGVWNLSEMNDGCVGNDRHGLVGRESATRSCSNIPGVKEGMRRRKSSSSKRKRSSPEIVAATPRETLPLAKRATPSSSFNSASSNEARAGSSGKVRIMDGPYTEFTACQGFWRMRGTVWCKKRQPQCFQPGVKPHSEVGFRIQS